MDLPACIMLCFCCSTPTPLTCVLSPRPCASCAGKQRGECEGQFGRVRVKVSLVGAWAHQVHGHIILNQNLMIDKLTKVRALTCLYTHALNGHLLFCLGNSPAMAAAFRFV
jgi:hypothetical protein